MNENRPLIKGRFPGLNLAEFAKKAGELWHDMGDKSVSLSYLFQMFLAYKIRAPKVCEKIIGKALNFLTFKFAPYR